MDGDFGLQEHLCPELMSVGNSVPALVMLSNQTIGEIAPKTAMDANLRARSQATSCMRQELCTTNRANSMLINSADRPYHGF
jgi:hypothetical protein